MVWRKYDDKNSIEILALKSILENAWAYVCVCACKHAGNIKQALFIYCII